MGTRRRQQRQEQLSVATATLARPASHPFYERLNRLLDECRFDSVRVYVGRSTPQAWVVLGWRLGCISGC
jgi:hypothetical protein